MRILLAPDKWKDCLSATQAAHALQKGFQYVFPQATFSILPIADGGEGTSQLFVTYAKAQWITASTTDALDRPIQAQYAWLPDSKTAIIDSSAANGLAMLSANERHPMDASTRGVGLLIAHAAALGAKEILLGLGGSATNDAGLGMAAALGWSFTDVKGRYVETRPRYFLEISQCHPPDHAPTFSLIGLTDVSNPLLGAQGCSRIFAKQKGATEGEIDFLEHSLTHVVEKLIPNGMALAAQAGAGAAGGLGWGILTFCRGCLMPGFDTLAERLNFDKLLQEVDLVVTAEGSVDAQTLQGKGPASLTARAAKFGVPTVVFAGSIEGEDQLVKSFAAVSPIANKPMSLEVSLYDAALLLENAAQRAARWMKLGDAIGEGSFLKKKNSK